MKNTGKTGISLVALIVTIIVLIILTAAVIVTFMEGGIIEKAKEAVFKSDIRTYQEILVVKKGEEQIKLATTVGGESELNADTLDKIKAILPEFKDEYENLIEIVNGEIVLGSKEDDPYRTWLIEVGIGTKTEDETGNTPIVHNGIIPEGGKYYVKVPENELGNMNGTEMYIYALGNYTGAETEYTAGDEFPIPQTGDVYVYGDYEYRYNMSFSAIEFETNRRWDKSESLNGWGVGVLDNTKTEYGKILTTIADKNIVSMDFTFGKCTNLVKSPCLPLTITSLYYSFSCCSSLVDAPEIPNGVINMSGTFFNCIALEVAPAIPNGVTNMMQTFGQCSSLKAAPEIPSSVTNLQITFANCTSLTQAPVIPSSVTNISWVFGGCSNLTGTIEINANLNINDEMSYYSALEGTKITWITGSISDELKQKIAEVNGITLVNPN